MPHTSKACVMLSLPSRVQDGHEAVPAKSLMRAFQDPAKGFGVAKCQVSPVNVVTSGPVVSGGAPDGSFNVRRSERVFLACSAKSLQVPAALAMSLRDK